LHAFRGEQPFFTYPRILGHELAVEVADLGSNEYDLKIGDRCAVEPYLNCGECVACRDGKPNCCIKLQVLGVNCDGGMREFLQLPARKLHRSNKLSFDQLVLVEPLGIGAHAVRRAGLREGEFALVAGVGPIGLSVILSAQIEGVRIIAMDVNEARLEFCRRHLGVEWCVDARTDPLEQLRAITSGDLPTVLFDATGNAESMMRAFEYVAHGGRIVFVGFFQGDVSFHDPNFHRRELVVMSSRNSTGEDFARIIKLTEAGKLNVTHWITHRAALSEMVREFPLWLKPESRVIKGMVEI
jgi:2-desacetyl-2-hydroxyethyl bacteriochlorophyllide A dehydrogenase